MKKLFLCLLMVRLMPIGCFPQQEPTVAKLLDRIDRNMVFKTAYSEVDMVITVKKRVVTKSLYSYAEEEEKLYMEFLSPPRDKGTRMLKIEDIVKIYYPSAERVVRLSGHMLRQNVVGSDFSYEDMTERAKSLREDYNAEIIGQEIIQGRSCYLLQLVSRIPRRTYYTRKAWVDKERYIVLKEELYARSGKLLKVLTVEEFKSFGDRFYPTRLTMRNMLRKDSQTEMLMKKIDFDIVIPPDTFSERQLLKD